MVDKLAFTLRWYDGRGPLTYIGAYLIETQCFLTIPAIIYQVLVPMWSRAWRLNNVWAIATIDTLFALLWFAASIAVAVWNADGIGKGKKKTEPVTPTKRADDVIKDGTCKSFAFGSVSKCNVSKATVGLGIIIFLMFVVTTAIAVHAIKHHKKTGVVPNPNFRRNQQDNSVEEVVVVTDKMADPWSTDTADLNTSNDTSDSFAYGQTTAPADQEGLLGAGHRRAGSDTYSHTDAEGMTHPGRRTSYHSTTQTAYAPASYDETLAPSALSPGFDPRGPNAHLQFPEANYNALR